MVKIETPVSLLKHKAVRMYVLQLFPVDSNPAEIHPTKRLTYNTREGRFGSCLRRKQCPLILLQLRQLLIHHKTMARC